MYLVRRLPFFVLSERLVTVRRMRKQFRRFGNQSLATVQRSAFSAKVAEGYEMSGNPQMNPGDTVFK
jgi:hypothetical protein